MKVEKNVFGPTYLATLIVASLLLLAACPYALAQSKQSSQKNTDGPSDTASPGKALIPEDAVRDLRIRAGGNAQVFENEVRDLRIRAGGNAQVFENEVRDLRIRAGGNTETPNKQIDDGKGELNSNSPGSSAYDDFAIEKWDFGIVTDRRGPTKDWKLHPVVVIPNLPGIQYAWKLKINRRNPVFVREEFTLPEAPSSWKIKEGETSSQLLNGGQLCVLENFQLTDDGWIGHSWTASRGDPAGKYEIKIWLNGKLAHTFVFNVGDAIESGKEAREI